MGLEERGEISAEEHLQSQGGENKGGDRNVKTFSSLSNHTHPSKPCNVHTVDYPISKHFHSHLLTHHPIPRGCRDAPQSAVKHLQCVRPSQPSSFPPSTAEDMTEEEMTKRLEVYK